MKRIRRISQNPFVLLLICANFLFVSCAKDQIISETIEYTGKEIMTAIFFADGPVLEKLPEIKNAVDISLFIDDETQLEEIRNINEHILDKFETTNPGAFEDFKLKMESGDHVVIKQTMFDYGLKLSDLVKSELDEAIEPIVFEQKQTEFIKIIAKYESNPTDQFAAKRLLSNSEFIDEFSGLFDEVREQSINGKVSITENASCVFWFAAMAAWIYIWWAIVAWTFFWVWNELYWGDIFVAIERSTEDSLLKDQIVNSIAINLSVK